MGSYKKVYREWKDPKRTRVGRMNWREPKRGCHEICALLGPPQLANSLLCLLIRLARLDDRRRGYPNRFPLRFEGMICISNPKTWPTVWTKHVFFFPELDKTCLQCLSFFLSCLHCH